MILFFSTHTFCFCFSDCESFALQFCGLVISGCCCNDLSHCMCGAVVFQAQTTLTTNDIVISKLTQILSYLRQGTRHKKMKKKDKGNAAIPVPPK